MRGPLGAETLTQLSEHLQSEGYAVIPKYLPCEPLQDLRLELLAVVRAAGWLEPGPLRAGVVKPALHYPVSKLEIIDVAREMFRIEALHALAHHPRLVGLFEALFKEAVLVHPNVIARPIYPNHPCGVTPSHQDSYRLKGTPDAFTVWIPLSDCPAILGGLQVAPRSHQSGVYRVQHLTDPEHDPFADCWLGGDYALGDIVIFHSMTVHRTHPNLSRSLRLSVDFRYQRLSEPIFPGHFCLYGQDWPRVYRDWRETRLQYYWQSLGVKLKPTVGQLRRTAQTGTNPEMVSKANEILQGLQASGFAT